MAIKIKAAQSFTDIRGIVHSAAHGVIRNINANLNPGAKTVSIRLELYIDQATADEGDSSAIIGVFQTSISESDFDTFFDEAVLLAASKSIVSQSELAILAKEVSPGVKLIDDTVWEVA